MVCDVDGERSHKAGKITGLTKNYCNSNHKLLHCMLNLKINTTSMLPQKNVIQLLDPLSPNSDQDHFSPNNTHTFLSEKLMRVTVKLRK